jgi:hypothetical protein
MRLSLLCIAVLALSCSDNRSSTGQQPEFSKAINKGIIDVRLVEASGLVESVANPHCFWSLNDGGNPAEVFLIDTLAKIKMVCKLSVKNRDWEDIAIGDGPIAGKKYIYVADIGDNLAVHKYKYIYRFEEPTIDGNKERAITAFDTLVIKLPGEKRDTETLMIDPTNSDLYVVSKREKKVHVYLQQFPYPDTLRPKKVLTLPFTLIVAGSISQNAQEVLLKNYGNVYYWKRSGEKALPELLAKPPIELPYDPEVQGESVCWSNDGAGYYTLSESHEGKIAQLKFYKRLK